MAHGLPVLELLVSSGEAFGFKVAIGDRLGGWDFLLLGGAKRLAARGLVGAIEGHFGSDLPDFLGGLGHGLG